MFRFGFNVVLIGFSRLRVVILLIDQQGYECDGVLLRCCMLFNVASVRHICIFHFFNFSETVRGDCTGSGWSKAAFMGIS